MYPYKHIFMNITLFCKQKYTYNICGNNIIIILLLGFINVYVSIKNKGKLKKIDRRGCVNVGSNVSLDTGCC